MWCSHSVYNALCSVKLELHHSTCLQYLFIIYFVWRNNFRCKAFQVIPYNKKLNMKVLLNECYILVLRYYSYYIGYIWVKVKVFMFNTSWRISIYYSSINVFVNKVPYNFPIQFKYFLEFFIIKPLQNTSK